MDKIIIAYWHGAKYSDLVYTHLQEYQYTVKRRNNIISKILEAGYSIMLRPNANELVIWIDSGGFCQK